MQDKVKQIIIDLYTGITGRYHEGGDTDSIPMDNGYLEMELLDKPAIYIATANNNELHGLLVSLTVSKYLGKNFDDVSGQSIQILGETLVSLNTDIPALAKDLRTVLSEVTPSMVFMTSDEEPLSLSRSDEERVMLDNAVMAYLSTKCYFESRQPPHFDNDAKLGVSIEEATRRIVMRFNSALPKEAKLKGIVESLLEGSFELHYSQYDNEGSKTTSVFNEEIAIQLPLDFSNDVKLAFRFAKLITCLRGARLPVLAFMKECGWSKEVEDVFMEMQYYSFERLTYEDGALTADNQLTKNALVNAVATVSPKYAQELCGGEHTARTLCLETKEFLVGLTKHSDQPKNLIGDVLFPPCGLIPLSHLQLTDEEQVKLKVDDVMVLGGFIEQDINGAFYVTSSDVDCYYNLSLLLKRAFEPNVCYYEGKYIIKL